MCPAVDRLVDCRAALDISQDIVELDLALEEGSDAQCDRAEAYSLLRLRQIAAARPYLAAAIESWVYAADQFRAEGRHFVRRGLEDYLSEVSLELPNEDKRVIESELWSMVLSSLDRDLREMRADLAEVYRGLEEWGDVEPAAVRYQKIVSKVGAGGCAC